ncbi:unnamed protein product [Lasius platythorax]|uniref:Uncharacterized protein n=1 Tax=Lasius platythorax TaxID=488582 RepID=A0AAV2MYX8_9HYME
MGRQALVSHMKSKKHATRRQNSVLETFLVSSPSSAGISSSAVPSNSVIFSISTKTASQSSGAESSSNVDLTNLLPNQPSNQLTNQPLSNQLMPRQLDRFLLKNDVTTAEVLWCIETVMSHKSLRIAEKDMGILKRMFQDSEIVKKM